VRTGAEVAWQNCGNKKALIWHGQKINFSEFAVQSIDPLNWQSPHRARTTLVG